jgi:hypothetical protein
MLLPRAFPEKTMHLPKTGTYYRTVPKPAGPGGFWTTVYTNNNFHFGSAHGPAGFFYRMMNPTSSMVLPPGIEPGRKERGYRGGKLARSPVLFRFRNTMLLLAREGRTFTGLGPRVMP